jgi:hypothetical protein
VVTYTIELTSVVLILVALVILASCGPVAVDTTPKVGFGIPPELHDSELICVVRPGSPIAHCRPVGEVRRFIEAINVVP